MSDIVEFLRARIDEDEQPALAAAGWDLSGSVRGSGVWSREGVNSVVDSSRRLVVNGDGPAPGVSQAEHIARHDPARVLRECAAKRAIIDTIRLGHLSYNGNLDEASFWIDLRPLAAIYSDHSDFDPAWR